ncbi:MAG: D-glycero-beta-D-manno-heptose-7-phosphate kinase [Proteobacteria bacterium]|nr:D-glycero-beta-D-manno-heptose-7-phosphate kinase [Pseudomonadota bacterium]
MQSLLFEKLFKDASCFRIAVFGDAILDEYRIGAVSRISPEAPVPILNEKRQFSRLGGACNVFRNLALSGARVKLFSVVGNDRSGGILNDLTAKSRGECFLLTEDGRRTPTKSRLLAEQQQILRIDSESTKDIHESLAENVIDEFKSELAEYCCVVLSDYQKGFLTESLTKSLIGLARDNDIPVIVDPKDVDFSKYAGASIVKPNLEESIRAYRVATSSEPADFLSMGQTLRREYRFPSLLVTRGKDGMCLFQKNSTVEFPTKAQEVYDVTGAGDTVTAYLSLGMASGLHLNTAIEVSNVAACFCVSKLGAVAPKPNELIEWVDNLE